MTAIPDAATRSDLQQAHEVAWKRLGQAGTWLTAEERLAVAAEARAAAACELCKTRKAALSPYGIKEPHLERAPLTATEVDIVHRIVTDPGRLTEAWFKGLGIAPERYVELLCVSAHVVAVDTFRRAVGLPAWPLPANAGGAPSRALPKRLDRTVAWVPVRALRGVPNIIRSISLVPDELQAVRDVTVAEYVPTERVTDLRFDARRALTRAQMEHVAGRVSARNGCFY